MDAYRPEWSAGSGGDPGAGARPGRHIRLGVLASGRGSNLQALLDAQAAGRLGAEIAVVLSDRGDAQALERARRHGVAAEHLDPGSSRARLRPEAEAQVVHRLRQHRVDWVILAGYFRIIGPILLEAFPDRIVNIHPSLLPSFPGLHAQKQALEYGVRTAGCTVHLVTAAVDAGPILAQAAVEVEADDDEDTLSARILRAEHRILVETVNRIAAEGYRIEGRTVRWTGAPPAAHGGHAAEHR